MRSCLALSALLCVQPAAAGLAQQAPAGEALVVLSTTDLASFNEALALAEQAGAEVPQAYAPNAFVAYLDLDAEGALRGSPLVARIERGIVDAASFRVYGGQAETAAFIWNTAFRGVRDPNLPLAPAGPAPDRRRPDQLIAPPSLPAPARADAPSSVQTSEYLAGRIVYSVVFVESKGGSGRCSPADPQTENWSAAQRSTALAEFSDGLSFWTSRGGRPERLTFVLDNQGVQATSCEPITRPAFPDQERWISDALTAMGYPANPGNFFAVARDFADSRRRALGADWAYTVFLVDSENDPDGSFADGAAGYAYLNGPFTVMTYDNGGWGIGRMNLIAAHESGHIFGALDEYSASGCSTADSWGYLDVANASCNNGGIRTDVSMMGEGSELADPSVDVSTSARGALGWRNPSAPGGTAIVDVVRTATASLTAFTPDPTSDRTPTYSAVAGNSPFPPGGCNTLGGTCRRRPGPVTISKVASAKWKLDGGAFTAAGLSPNDGAFDEEKNEGYRFTPGSPVAPGTHTFRTQSTNDFGDKSPIRKDVLTIQ